MAGCGVAMEVVGRSRIETLEAFNAGRQILALQGLRQP